MENGYINSCRDRGEDDGNQVLGASRKREEGVVSENYASRTVM